MRPIIIFTFFAGVFALVLHLISELDRPGIFSSPGLSAIGLILMAGVAQLIWGEK